MKVGRRKLPRGAETKESLPHGQSFGYITLNMFRVNNLQGFDCDVLIEGIRLHFRIAAYHCAIQLHQGFICYVVALDCRKFFGHLRMVKINEMPYCLAINRGFDDYVPSADIAVHTTVLVESLVV